MYLSMGISLKNDKQKRSLETFFEEENLYPIFNPDSEFEENRINPKHIIFCIHLVQERIQEIHHDSIQINARRFIWLMT